MIRIVTLITLLFSFSSVFAQGNIPFVFGTVGTLGREIKQTSEQRKTAKEQEDQEEIYFLTVSEADARFKEGEYAKAIDLYNQALAIKEEQYPRDQIARANAEIARKNNDEYQLLIDKADSLYNQLNYDKAIETYNLAIAKRGDQYPKDQITKVKFDQEHSKQVQFSGLLISDIRIETLSSKAFSNDPYSDFLKTGKYASIDQALIYSNYQTLDGIAVPPNTRIIIYKLPNFKGEVLLDVSGPAIINNVTYKEIPDAKEIQTKPFIGPLEINYPASVRSWSTTDMKTWIGGSMDIIAI
jgi:tetratricopeptide (TPR) repeat protein